MNWTMQKCASKVGRQYQSRKKIIRRQVGVKRLKPTTIIDNHYWRYVATKANRYYLDKYYYCVQSDRAGIELWQQKRRQIGQEGNLNICVVKLWDESNNYKLHRQLLRCPGKDKTKNYLAIIRRNLRYATEIRLRNMELSDTLLCRRSK